MFIKFIILEGFKSYRDKTVLGPLDPGQNIVFGRNGAGKSNFFCAVEFIFSAQMVNQTERINLLHSNTDHRVLSAHVEIIFDNSDRRFPIEKDEFSMKRVIRNKEDCFLIDSKIVTRNEILRLMESAGFSPTNPYNIVRQGQIHRIANCSPKGLLDVINEIAGTRVYEEKKIKTNENLENTDRLMEDSGQQLEDIQRQIESLEEDRKRMEKYRSYNKMKKQITVKLHQLEVEECRSKKSNLEDEFKENDLISHLAEINENYQTKADEKSALKREVDEMKAEYQNTVQEKEEEDKRLEKLSTEVARITFTIEDKQNSQSHDSQGELEELELELERRIVALEQMRGQHRTLTDSAEEISKNIDIKLNKSKWIRAKNTHHTRFESKAARDAWLKKEMKEQNNFLQLSYNSLKQLRESETNIRVELDLLTRLEESNKANLNDILNKIDSDRQDKALRLMEKNENLTKISEIRGQLREYQYQIEKQRENVETRFREIGQRNSRVRDLMQAKVSIDQLLNDMDGGVLDGYYGMLVDLFEPKDQDGIALLQTINEVAGLKLFYHVVQNKQIATFIMKELNRKGMRGEFNFLPLDQLKPKRLKEYTPMSGTAPLLPKLGYQERFQVCMEFVFGAWIVSKSIDIASNARKNRQGYNFITLEGDKVESNCLLTGGYINKNSMLIKYLNYKEGKEDLDQNTAKLDEKERLNRQMETNVRTLQIEVEKFENRTSRNTVKAESIQSELRIVESTKKDLQLREVEVHNAVIKKVSEVEKLKSQIDDLKGELKQDILTSLSEEDRTQLKSLDVEVKKLNEVYKKQNLNLNKLTKKMAAAENNIEVNLRPSIAEIKAGGERRASVEEEVKRLTSELEVLNQDREQCSRILSRLVSAEKNGSDALKKRTCGYEKVEIGLRKLELKRAEIWAGIAQFEEKRGRLTRRIEELLLFITELDPLTRLGSEQEISKKRLMKKLDSINKKLESEELGNIDQKALLEFEKLVTEQAEIEEKLAYLVEALEATRQTMNMLEDKKIEQITYTFKQVQRYFDELFKKIVPNGQGTIEIRCSDESPGDIREAIGLEIQVCFTNKRGKMKNLNSLSGGQKAAVSLIFILAIQKCDPAPFYVFDEIDAALDPDHRDAIAAVIKEQSASAQFIATTFRRELLLNADKYFRVSMLHSSSSHVQEVDRNQAVQFIQSQEMPQ